MIGYVLMIGLFLVFLGSVVYGLWWAITKGQMSDFAKGATSIFDADEPVGAVTDSFPQRQGGGGHGR